MNDIRETHAREAQSKEVNDVQPVKWTYFYTDHDTSWRIWCTICTVWTDLPNLRTAVKVLNNTFKRFQVLSFAVIRFHSRKSQNESNFHKPDEKVLSDRFLWCCGKMCDKTICFGPLDRKSLLSTTPVLNAGQSCQKIQTGLHQPFDVKAETYVALWSVPSELRVSRTFNMGYYCPLPIRSRTDPHCNLFKMSVDHAMFVLRAGGSSHPFVVACRVVCLVKMKGSLPRSPSAARPSPVQSDLTRHLI